MMMFCEVSMSGYILAFIFGWFIGYLLGWGLRGKTVVEQVELQGGFIYKGKVYELCAPEESDK
jgi:hypothetical protein